MARELENHVCIYLEHGYCVVSPLPQQCIRVLILLHGVGSEILSYCMYVPVYVFGIVSTVFFFFFSLFVFCTLLRIKV